MMAIWIWQSQAWTQPQSWLGQFQIGMQFVAMMLPLYAALLIWKRRRK